MSSLCLVRIPSVNTGGLKPPLFVELLLVVFEVSPRLPKLCWLFDSLLRFSPLPLLPLPFVDEVPLSSLKINYNIVINHLYLDLNVI